MFISDAPRTLDEARVIRYGEWSGNPRGSSYSEGKCAMEVWPSGAWIARQCNRKNGYGPAELYCKGHARQIVPRTTTTEDES